jgi:hypothetical protein
MILSELANNNAIDFFISDLGNNTHSQFYDALSEGNIPDDVSVWYPFENCDADNLLEHIENLTLCFISFHKEAKNAEDQ